MPRVKLLDSMRSDKKVQKGNLRFIVMKEIGESFIEQEVDLTYVIDVLETIGAE